MPKNEKGLTLVELLVAMAITAILFLGLTEGILISVDYNLRNALRDEAVVVGANRMNEIRNLPFGDLDLAVPPDNVIRRVRNSNVAYTVTRTVTPVAANVRQVNIAVAWTRAAKSYSHVVSTIVRQ